jgi:subtilisin
MKIPLFVSVLVASTSISTAQLIPNRYIAVLDDDVQDVPAAAQALAAQHGVAVGYVYQHALKGFAFGGAPQAAAALARRTGVAYVEQEQVFEAWGETIPTGIARANVPSLTDSWTWI